MDLYMMKHLIRMSKIQVYKMKPSQLKQFVKAVLKEVAAPTLSPANQLKTNVYKKLGGERFEKKGEHQREYMEYYLNGFATVQVAVNSDNSNVVRIERYFDNERYDHKNFVKSYPIPDGDLTKFENQVVAVCLKIKANIEGDESIFGGSDDDLQENNSDICSTCNGSGEGMADGTRCLSCGGSGRDDDSGDRKSRSGKEDDFDHDDTEVDDARCWGGMDESSEEKERNDLISQISDDYKSLHGMRPRRDMSGYSMAELKAMADQLSSDIHVEIEREKQDAIQHDKATKKAMTPTKWNIGDLTGLKEGSSEQPIYKDRQGGQDVYWMDNRDSGGKIHLKPEAVAKMVKRGHRVIDINEPMKETSQPEPYDAESDTFQPSPRERTSQSSQDIPSDMVIQSTKQNIYKAETDRKIPHKVLSGMNLGQLQKYYNEIGLFDGSVFVNGRWGGTPMKENQGGIELTPFGQEDEWGRPVYTDQNRKFYVDVNLGKGTPSIHSVTDQGEPEFPIKNFKIKTPMKENEGGQHLINGQSNIVAASRVNKLLAALSRGVFSDNSWEAIHKIFDKLTEAGLEVNTIDAKYGGHADTGNGMPKYKEWRISIPFTNNKGKAVELVGQITAHGAGSVDQPLDRYDITAMVTPMMVKNQQRNENVGGNQFKLIKEHYWQKSPKVDKMAPNFDDEVEEFILDYLKKNNIQYSTTPVYHFANIDESKLEKLATEVGSFLNKKYPTYNWETSVGNRWSDAGERYQGGYRIDVIDIEYREKNGHDSGSMSDLTVGFNKRSATSSKSEPEPRMPGAAHFGPRLPYKGFDTHFG